MTTNRYYVVGAIGTVVFAVGACVVAAGLGEGQRGAPRVSRLWLGAILLVVASLAVTISELYLHTFYSANDAVYEATIGTLVAAVGTFFTAVAGVVFVRGVKRPFAARERSVAAAGAIAVAATLLVAAGEALTALAYSRHGDAGWQATVTWLAVASRLFFASAFAALALGARRRAAAQPSTPEARRRRRRRSLAFSVSSAARRNSAAASVARPNLASRSPRTLGTRW
ncbi:MAG: hypothetical protein JWO14_2692 [Solirubrobacterales bacterium]|nr:hypothetical protein [Solirubrobacterales bacterium]